MKEVGWKPWLACFKILLFWWTMNCVAAAFFPCIIFSPQLLLKHHSPRGTLTALGEEGRGEAGKFLSSALFWVHWTAGEGLIHTRGWWKSWGKDSDGLFKCQDLMWLSKAESVAIFVFSRSWSGGRCSWWWAPVKPSGDEISWAEAKEVTAV